MFGPKITTVFQSRWKAVFWSLGILATAYCTVPMADEARQHRRRGAEAAARELPVRLSFPLVLCTLPAFVLVAIVPLLVGALSSLRST